MNNMIRAAFTFLLALGYFISFDSLANTPVSPSLAPMLQKVLPSVVNIRAQIKITDISTLNKLQKMQRGEVPDKFLSVGSGVIINGDKGYILTNAHVVDDAERVIVTLSDGRHYTAKILGADKPSDIALLQIQ